MFKKKIFFTLALFTCLLFYQCEKKNKSLLNRKNIDITNDQIKIINSFIDRTKENYEIPGLSICILSNNKINSFYKGVQSIKTKKEINSNTIFNSLDLSELIIATAILKLKEEGKLKLSDNVVQHLPYFKLKDSLESNKITIKQLLTQTSGLPLIGLDISRNNDAKNALEGTTKSIKYLPLESSPGKTYKKTFFNYDILADIISKKTGMTFENFMKKEIFTPLDMSSSSYSYKDVNKNNLCVPYKIKRLKDTIVTPLDYYPYNRENLGSSGLQASSQDLINWATMILNNGYYKNKVFLEENSVGLFLKPFHSVGEDTYIGQSWEIEALGKKLDNNIYYKSFSREGFSGSVILYPKFNLAIVTQANLNTTFNINLIGKNILDFLVGKTKKINSIKIPIAKILVQTYENGGIDEAIHKFKSLKNNSIYDYSLDNLISFINYIKETSAEDDIVTNKEDLIKTLNLFESEFPNSHLSALTIARAYVTLNDKTRARNYIKKAKELSKNNPQVIAYCNELERKMRVSNFNKILDSKSIKVIGTND